jgi:AGZA family xanthine/uracil permease-like MFS transporter
MLERLFRLEERRTTVTTELRAGLVTFLTMAYILFVNADILSKAGMPAADVVLATALASAVATLVMGLYANFPFALAPGMGLNAFFAFGVVVGLGVSWQVALAAVFVEGLLFLALSLTGLRSALLDAIPRVIKLGTTAGIGLFLALIGFENAGLVVADPATLVRLGEVREPLPALALAGLLAAAALLALEVRGGLLVTILGVAAVAWVTGLAPAPESLLSRPQLPRETLAAFDFGELLSGTMVTVVLAFLFVDLLDTAGTLLGVGQLAGFVDEEGRFPGSERAFVADAVGTTVGALLGTSTVTTYVESATGVEEGGRTGLTAVATAALFLLALFFTPVFTAVPAAATAPALVVVGAMMMRGVGGVDWRRLDEAVPAFLTLTVMPFTYSIANGLAIGVVSWVAIKVLTGKAREVGALMWVLAPVLVVYYAFLRAA